jgi:hypothetical protein
MNETDEALVTLILYVILPIWGIAGYVDWYCHKRSKIESTSGTFESVMHSVMGLQVGIPIFLCLVYRVNALILIVCLISLILHEFVAHHDVKFASTKRDITIMEVHAHNYLATTPLYLLLMVVAINWKLVVLLVTGQTPPYEQFGDQFAIERSNYTLGGDHYLPTYYSFMIVACVLPYIEEMLRCLRWQFQGIKRENFE